MSGLFKTTIKTKSTGCRILSSHCHVFALFDNRAFLEFVLIVVLKGPDTVLAPVRTHQHVQYVPVDTFLFCTLKVIMVVVASSHGIIESLVISLTSHWRRLNPQTAKGEMSLQPRAETSLTSLWERCQYRPLPLRLCKRKCC